MRRDGRSSPRHPIDTLKRGRPASGPHGLVRSAVGVIQAMDRVVAGGSDREECQVAAEGRQVGGRPIAPSTAWGRRVVSLIG